MNEITTAKENTQLATIVKESGLEQSKAQVILERFTDFFEVAADWERKAKELVITEVTQVADMKKAEEGRKFLKTKRIEVENIRKVLKEASLKEGQTIDSIARILKNLIEPIETDLEKKANFEKYKIEEERLRKEQERMKLLEPYNVSIDKNIIANMAQEMFDVYLKGVIAQHEEKKERERIAEEIRIKEDNERTITLTKEREKNEKKIKRINELASLGFVFENPWYKCYDNAISITQIEEENDDAFEAFVTQSKNVIALKKTEEAEQKKVKEKLTERINTVVGLGLRFDFKETYIKDDFNIHITEIKCDTDEVFNQKIEKITNEIIEREKKAEADKKILEEQLLKKEQENKELKATIETVQIKKNLTASVKKTASEKTKLLDFAKILESIEYPVLKTEEANIILNDAKNQLSKIVNFVKTSAETL